MKINLMLKYFISTLVTLSCIAIKTNASVSNDSQKKFGIRIGTDIQKIIRTTTLQKLKPQENGRNDS